MPKLFAFEDLSTSDLVVDAVDEGAPGGHISGEALSAVLPGVGNQGGFRALGRGGNNKLVALYTSGEDRDWPDSLDPASGRFVYYGDNKHPGHELHETRRGGNKLLRRSFERLHSCAADRRRIAPFFIFQKYPTDVSSRSVQFRGLGVPGFDGLPATSDLVAVWKTTDGQRFQNYRSTFTILDAPVVSRTWLEDLGAGQADSPNAPAAWKAWLATGRRKALRAPNTTVVRELSDQVPDTAERNSILEAVWKHFKDDPISFEPFAARLYQMFDPRLTIEEITRGVVDGGRDAVGRLHIGLPKDPVSAEFSLEAKCYRPALNGNTANTVGVKEISRLISRIRNRQFGVLVTTSAVARQAYQEVREDGHPIVFLSGRDIADILITCGYGTVEQVRAFLEAEFPR